MDQQNGEYLGPQRHCEQMNPSGNCLFLSLLVCEKNEVLFFKATLSWDFGYPTKSIPTWYVEQIKQSDFIIQEHALRMFESKISWV